MLHSLRKYIGELAFWAGTRRLIYATSEPWSLSYAIAPRFRTTEDFISIMSEEAAEDIAWLVETYLYEAGMPELQTKRSADRLELVWRVPGGRPFPMPVTVAINGEEQRVAVSRRSTSITVPEGAQVILDPHSEILRALPIIGDCSEQTDTQILYNIDRYSRMAREYG